MSLTVRGLSAAMPALVMLFNSMRKADVAANTSYPHYHATSVTNDGDWQRPVTTAISVSHATPTSLATRISGAEALRTVFLAHINDAFVATDPLRGGAHDAVDTTNLALISFATLPKLTSASVAADVYALLNALKAAWAHVAQAGVHPTDDTTNLVTAPNATDASSADTLWADLKAKLNAHIALAPAMPVINVI